MWPNPYRREYWGIGDAPALPDPRRSSTSCLTAQQWMMQPRRWRSTWPPRGGSHRSTRLDPSSSTSGRRSSGARPPVLCAHDSPDGATTCHGRCSRPDDGRLRRLAVSRVRHQPRCPNGSGRSRGCPRHRPASTHTNHLCRTHRSGSACPRPGRQLRRRCHPR